MRVYVLKVVVLSLLMVTLKSYSQTARELSKLEKMVLTSTGEVVKLFKEKSESIWPYFDLSMQPFIVYIPNKWVLLVNYDKDIDGFSEYPEDWPDIFTDAKLRLGNFIGLNGQLQFNFKIDSIETLAIGFPEGFFNVDEPYTMIEIFGFIIHESFHQFQRQSFGEIPWAREEKYPILDSENSALCYIEMQLLINALEAMNADDEEKCRKLLKYFATVRENRWEMADNFVKQYEQGQELNEGTAKYVEAKSIHLLRESKNNRNYDIDPNLYAILTSDKVEKYLELEFNHIMGNNCISPDDMIRNRIYPTGAAEGILLDYTGIDWKKEAQKAGTDFTFTGLISDSAAIKIETSKYSLSEILEEYDYQSILSNTTQQIKEYTELYESELKEFENQSGIRIEILFNYKSLARAGNTRAKKWIMNNGSESLCMDYRLFKLETESLTCLLENIAVYQVYDWDNKHIKVVFYTEELGSSIINNIEYPIQKVSDSEFENISLKGKGIEISMKHAGRIELTGKNIIITQNLE